jgi:hypothetical protein
MNGGYRLPLRRTERLTEEDASRIVEMIRPCFVRYLSEYDCKKYPPEVYMELVRSFRTADGVTDKTIRSAVIWKFGHTGKSHIPTSHEALISFLRKRWPEVSASSAGSASEGFDRFIRVLGPGRYITACFFLHLLRPIEIPIIDQHNFRAINYYIGAVHPSHRNTRKPSKYADLVTLINFLNAIRSAWSALDPSTVPSHRELDRFLMMFGRSLKWREKKMRGAIQSTSRVDLQMHSVSNSDSDPRGRVRLPFGGPGAAFKIGDLMRYLKDSGRSYIIQGQTQCTFGRHPKPSSLDFWLRKNHAKNPDTKQAVNSVVCQIISTGLFTEGKFTCPDTKHLCKGIQIVANNCF